MEPPAETLCTLRSSWTALNGLFLLGLSLTGWIIIVQKRKETSLLLRGWMAAGSLIPLWLALSMDHFAQRIRLEGDTLVIEHTPLLPVRSISHRVPIQELTEIRMHLFCYYQEGVNHQFELHILDRKGRRYEGAGNQVYVCGKRLADRFDLPMSRTQKFIGGTICHWPPFMQHWGPPARFSDTAAQ